MEEFKQITGQTESPEDVINLNWHKWQPKILPYASLSSKASIKDLTAQKQNDIPNGMLTICILLLLLNACNSLRILGCVESSGAVQAVKSQIQSK